MKSKTLVFCLLAFITCQAFAQSFEGKIIYKIEANNPNPERIPQEVWDQQIKQLYGPKGFFEHTYYYRPSTYASTVEMLGVMTYQVYHTEEQLLYTWSGSPDTVFTIDSKKSMDELVSIVKMDGVEEVMGRTCNALLVTTKMGRMTIWYEPGYLPMDPEPYEHHVYGQWKYILEEIECLPLKIVTESPMITMIQTAVEVEEGSIPDSNFEIPDAKAVLPSPMN